MVKANCKKLTQEKFLEYGFDAVILEDLTVDNGADSSRVFDEEVYLFAAFSHYGHSLVDIYAQYKILQKKYPALRPVMFERGENGWLAKNSNIANDLAQMLNQTLDDVIDITTGNFYFKKVILFFDMNNTFSNEFYSSHGADRSLHYFPFCSCYLGTEPCGKSEYFKYNYLAINVLKEEFSKFFSEEQTKNIYISRKNYNDQYLQSKAYILSKPSLSPEDEAALVRISLRCYEHEDLVQSFFEDLGYESVYAEDLGFFEQIRLFSAAKSIVSVSGTGLFNAFWCPPTTEVIEILAVPGYHYHYKEFAEHAGVSYRSVNITGLPPEQVKEALKTVLPENGSLG